MMAGHRPVGGLAAALALLGAAAALAGHGSPPPPLPPGHGVVLIRLIWLPDSGQIATGDQARQVSVQAIEVRRAGRGPGEGWVSLPPLRSELSVQELISGQVWVASAPAPAGEFDRIRLRAGAASEAPIALRLAEGQSVIATMYVGVQKGRTGSPLRLELRRVSASPS
jgi:hypothetical protein